MIFFERHRTSVWVKEGSKQENPLLAKIWQVGMKAGRISGGQMCKLLSCSSDCKSPRSPLRSFDGNLQWNTAKSKWFSRVNLGKLDAVCFPMEKPAGKKQRDGNMINLDSIQSLEHLPTVQLAGLTHTVELNKKWKKLCTQTHSNLPKGLGLLA